MSDDKPSVNLVRPLGKDRHSAREWAEHINLREDEEAIRDIRNARLALAKLTVRSFVETFCYDEPQIAAYILGQMNGDELIGDLAVDHRTLRKLADKVGGAKTKSVVERSELREIKDEEPEPEKDVGEQQVKLLKALFATMDPDVVKRALRDD
jgi:hypothetical protein